MRIMVDTAEIDPATNQPFKLPMPAHFGRRCQAFHPARDGFSYQCNHRWSSKECPDPMCKADNDIAARYCTTCKGEIIDPNTKLTIEFKRQKRDATQMQCDEVLSMTCKPTLSGKGKKMYVVEFVTPYRQFVVYMQAEATHYAAIAECNRFMEVTENMAMEPTTITYRKDSGGKGFYRIYDYNKPADSDGL